MNRKRIPRPAEEKTTPSGDYMTAFEAQRKAIQKEMPSVSELAQIAALLNQGRAVEQSRSLKLAEQALMVWESCSTQLILIARAKAAKAIATDKARALRNKIPEQGKYPIPYSKFLRNLVGGKSHGDREALFRNYLKEQAMREPGCDEEQALTSAADQIASFKCKGVPYDYYHGSNPVWFLDWCDAHKKQQRKLNAKRAVSAKWKKES